MATAPLIIFTIFALFAVSSLTAAAETPFVVVHKKASVLKLKSGPERLSVSIDVYNHGSVAIYDVSLTDDSWSTEIFDFVAGNTSSSWEKLDANPGCYIGAFIQRSSMEDQIYRTNEDSWSKDLAEIRSMLQEWVATSKPTRIEFQRFCGENPDLWISQAERYFDVYEIAENHKLSLASSYLDGAALTWYQWLLQNKQLADWEHFTAKVLIRFRKRHLNSSEGRLANLWQIPSVTEYPSRFEAVSSGFSEPDILSSCLAHVHPQWSDISNSPLRQTNDEQSEYPTKIDEHKMFDEMSHTTVSSEMNDVHTMIHEGENFATIVAKLGDDSFSEGINLQIKVPTAVLVYTKESNVEEEDNPQDNVILIDKCPKQDTSDSLVPFPSQGIVIWNMSMRIVATEYPFEGVLWHHPIPCLHNSLEDKWGEEQTRVSPYLDFSLHKCNWVDTGQECNLPSFLSSDSGGYASEDKIQEVLTTIIASYAKKSPYTRAIRLLFDLVHKERLNSLYIVFDPCPYVGFITIYAIGSIFGGGKSMEESIEVVLIECPSGKFPIEQVLSMQIGSSSDIGNRFGTYICCHIGTCTYFHWESEVIQWNVPFSRSVDNWFDTGQDDLGYTANLYDWQCVGGVEMDAQSYDAFNTSFATYKLLGEFIKHSLICLYNGLGSLRALPHSTLDVKSEEEDSDDVIGKKVIISLVGKSEYNDAVILAISTLVKVISVMASLVDLYLDKPTRYLISSTLQYSGNFGSREPKILVSYLKSIWLLVLRGLNNSKTPCFLKPLLQPLPHASIVKRHFLGVAHNYQVLYHWWIHLGINVYKHHDSPKPFIFRSQKIHNTGHRALQLNSNVTFLDLQCKELLQHKEMGTSWMRGNVCWISLTLWLDIHNSFSFLEPNLEDKVLIEGGSIVVNRVGSVRTYGLEVVKDTNLVGIIGPSKMLESFVWDPGPLSYLVKTRLCARKKGMLIMCSFWLCSSHPFPDGSHVSHTFDLESKVKTTYYSAPAVITYRIPTKSKLQVAYSTPIPALETFAEKAVAYKLDLAKKLLAQYGSHVSLVVIVFLFVRIISSPSARSSAANAKKRH